MRKNSSWSKRLFAAVILLGSLLVESGPAITSAEAAFYTTNLAFKLDAQDSNSYTTGSNTWTDVSGSNNNFTRAASGSTRPLFNAGSGGPSSFLFTREVQTATGSPPPNGTFFSGAAGSNTNFAAGSFTVAAWIRVPSGTTAANAGHWLMMHVLSAEQPTVTYDWGFGVDNNGKIAFGTGGTSDASVASSVAVNTNTWVFVAATRTLATNSVSVYVNDSAAVTSTLNNGGATKALTANGVLRLGAGDDGGVSFGGNIAAVYGYTAALTAQQILDDFNATKGAYGFLTPTTTTLTSLNSTTSFGLVDTLTATVNNSAATGTMNFLNNGTSISGCSSATVTSGVANCAFLPGALGNITNLTASYSGDSTYDVSTSSAISITVTLGAPVLTLMTPATAEYRRSTSIFTISSPSGTDGKVTFTFNGKKIAGCIKLQSASLMTQCRWLPSQHTFIKIGASLTPSNTNFGVASALPKFITVLTRTNVR